MIKGSLKGEADNRKGAVIPIKSGATYTGDEVLAMLAAAKATEGATSTPKRKYGR